MTGAIAYCHKVKTSSIHAKRGMPLDQGLEQSLPWTASLLRCAF